MLLKPCKLPYYLVDSANSILNMLIPRSFRVYDQAYQFEAVYYLQIHATFNRIFRNKVFGKRVVEGYTFRLLGV